MSADLTHPMGSEGSQAPERAGPPDVIHEQPDSARRRVLVAATTALGGIGVAITAVPFVGSMLPSERAKAAGAPVETDISTLEPGALLTVEWQGKPVWILHRTGEMLRLLGEDEQRLSDPQSAVPQQPAYCRNPTRSIKPGFLVAVGICTHLGCVPTFSPATCARRSRPRRARRFLLSMSCLQIRSRGKSVQKRSGSDQSGNSAARLFKRFPPDHRHGSQVVKNQGCRPRRVINIFPHKECSHGN